MTRETDGMSAVTLLEICVAIVIVLILGILLLPAVGKMRARGERVQCMSNLRTLYASTEMFIQQNGSWPQIHVVDDDSDASEQQYARDWIAALKPFGVAQQSWICPTMQQLMHAPDLTKPENVRIDYVACNFDDKPTTPHLWARQPWFAEAGDVHGNGNLIIFTDGSISDLKTVAGAK